MNELFAGLTFGEPPPEPKANVESKYAPVIAAIKTHAETCEADPDKSEWVKLPGTWPLSAASNWKNGRIAGIENGEFDAVVRNVQKKTVAKVDTHKRPLLDVNGEEQMVERQRGDLYVRFIGQQGVAMYLEEHGINDEQQEALKPYMS